MKRKNPILFASTSALVLGAAPAAMSQINYSNIGVTVTTSTSYNLDLNGSPYGNYVVQFDSGGGAKPEVTSLPTDALSTNNDYVLGTPDPAQDNKTVGFPLLGVGATVGQNLVVAGTNYSRGDLYQDYGGRTVGGWSGSSTSDGFVGLQLISGGGSVTNFGWVELQYSQSAGTITIVDSAYDTTPGESLLTGEPVPEPSTIALVGTSVAMLTVRLRSRKK